MKIAVETSQKLKNMSFLCAMLVVTMHIGLSRKFDSQYWLVGQLISEGVARIAVPFFFVVSGFFLAAHVGEPGWWRREVGKRVSTLVIPFYVWSLLFVVTSFSLKIVADALAQRPFGESTGLLLVPTWLQILGLDLTRMPLHYPLWFVRNLFLLVLLSPVIASLTHRFGWGWIVFCLLLDIVMTCVLPLEPFFGSNVFSLSGLMYFSLGFLIRKRESMKATRNAAIALGVAGLALLGLKMVFYANAWGWQGPFGKFVCPCLLYTLWYFMPTKAIPDWLTTCSFPIYLMHILFFPYVGVALKYLHVDVSGGLLGSIVCYIVGIVGSIVLTHVIRSYWPRCASIAYGGRVCALSGCGLLGTTD